jgi:hypothetical protein
MSDKRKTNRIVWAVIATISALILLINSLASGANDPNAGPHLYLPVMTNAFPAPPSVFGAEVHALDQSHGVDAMMQGGASWVRFNAIVWTQVEPQKGVYDWSSVDTLKTQLQAYQGKPVNVIMIVRGTPTWAREFPTIPCGPIKPSEYPEFAKFMNTLVGTLSVPPYNVKYWEIGNEPDAPVVAQDVVFGCWGQPGTTNYGGEEYGNMLRAVYPAVKQADPNSKVVVGGLLLDCDPNNPPSGKDCSSSRFLIGVMANGNGAFFDGVAYHAYDYYQSPGLYYNPNWHADISTGPSSINRDLYIKSLLAGAGYNNKLLLNTETSVVCTGDASVCNDSYENTKAAYVAVDYASAIVNKVSVRIWYDVFGGWRYSGLMYALNSPRPAYFAFKTAYSELGSATYSTSLAQPQIPAGVKGFEFTRDNRTVWFLWATSLNSYQVTFNSVPANAFDTVGQPITTSKTMTVDNNPRYFEWIGKP